MIRKKLKEFTWGYISDRQPQSAAAMKYGMIANASMRPKKEKTNLHLLGAVKIRMTYSSRKTPLELFPTQTILQNGRRLCRPKWYKWLSQSDDSFC